MYLLLDEYPPIASSNALVEGSQRTLASCYVSYDFIDWLKAKNHIQYLRITDVDEDTDFDAEIIKPSALESIMQVLQSDDSPIESAEMRDEVTGILQRKHQEYTHQTHVVVQVS